MKLDIEDSVNGWKSPEFELDENDDEELKEVGFDSEDEWVNVVCSIIFMLGSIVAVSKTGWLLLELIIGTGLEITVGIFMAGLFSVEISGGTIMAFGLSSTIVSDGAHICLVVFGSTNAVVSNDALLVCSATSFLDQDVGKGGCSSVNTCFGTKSGCFSANTSFDSGAVSTAVGGKDQRIRSSNLVFSASS
jgi:hypothetical protein